MEIKQGIAVSPGIAIGPVLVLDTEGVVISNRSIAADQVEAEVQRLADALVHAAEQARERQRTLTAQLGKSIGDIFQGHAFLYEDPSLRRDIETLIRDEQFSAEYAVSRAIRAIIKKFDVLTGDGSIQRFRADLLDLEKQVLGQLIHVTANDWLHHKGNAPVIVLAHDLTPSETSHFESGTVLAFVTESGGPTSHTAIMAGALEIPAIVGVGRFLSDVSGGEIVIVDADTGQLILDPDADTLREAGYREEAFLAARRAVIDEPMRDIPATTLDGVPIALMGNIEFPNEASHCVERGGEGVGLYRTEFLYVNKTTDPTEEEHYEAYRAVRAAINPKHPVVIRTLDLGADKFSAISGPIVGEKNPFLGMRSVRLCLVNLPIFKTQLRAILRAARHGEVHVMFPMVTTVLELRQCKSLLNEVCEDLDDEGIPYNSDIRIGTMIEVPSAAILADVLAKEVDFFSIGTNDLVQYTLAADRNNETVSGLYNPADPAVLRLIRNVCEAARGHDVTVNVCGEMSGEPLYTPLLLGLGIRSMSATPRKIPELKKVIRALTMTECERITDEVMRCVSAREVTTYLREQYRRNFPKNGV